MFSNLDNFINASNHRKVEVEVPEEEHSIQNESFDLDLSLPSIKATKKRTEDKEKNNKASFVPAKGQKLAAKRLQKITDQLDKNLEQIEKTGKKQTAASKAKPKSPKKPTATKSRTRGLGTWRQRARQQRYDDDDDLDLLDSDSEMYESSSQSAPSSSARSNHQPHDPNTIVLDCDDVFDGVPAVSYTRNFATASAVTAKESMELKVNVRINGKIEHFYMNPFQKMSTLATQISEKLSVPSDHIALMFKEKTISNSETPNSIGYIQGLVIKAHISSMVKSKSTGAGTSKNENAGQLEIKIQVEGRKRPFITHIGSKDKLITLAFACAEEFKCDLDKVILEFDGDFIDFKETAESLGLEGGEMMDFYEKSK